MSLDLRPQKYYRPKVFSNQEINDINSKLVYTGPCYSDYYQLNRSIIMHYLNSDMVLFVPRNGRYHDLEYDWSVYRSTNDSGCHYYSGLIPFDSYYHFWGPEAKGSCCDGSDRSCSGCCTSIVLNRWWKKFKERSASPFKPSS